MALLTAEVAARLGAEPAGTPAALLAAGVDALEAGWIAEACTTSLHTHRPVRMEEVRT